MIFPTAKAGGTPALHVDFSRPPPQAASIAHFYLRLNDKSVPSIYGPTADEKW